MKRETITWKQEIKVFEVGEKVQPTSPRCPLSPGTYTVVAYHRPLFAGEEPIVFVEGRSFGVSAEHLIGVEVEKP